MCLAELQLIPILLSCLTRPVLIPTICRTRVEHANITPLLRSTDSINNTPVTLDQIHTTFIKNSEKLGEPTKNLYNAAEP
jgi:hypothetical protein